MYDLSAMTRDADFARSRVLRGFIERSWGVGDELLAQSPITHIEALGVPVLVAHGTADARVPFSQALALRKALDEHAKPYEWLEFKGEGHGFYRPENHEKFLGALLAFLDKHTAGTPP